MKRLAELGINNLPPPIGVAMLRLVGVVYSTLAGAHDHPDPPGDAEMAAIDAAVRNLALAILAREAARLRAVPPD